MTKYGYARVSTRGQLDGYSLEIQEKKLLEYGCEEVVFETYSGATVDRPALQKLLSHVKPGDEIVVTRVDRLARTLRAGLDLFDMLDAKGVTARMLDFEYSGELSGTPFAILIRNMLLMVAEHEWNVTSERNKGNKAIAESRGKTVGRPSANIDVHEFERLRKRVNRKEITVKEACAALGIGRTKWYELVKGAA